jgi:hypothetical protein
MQPFSHESFEKPPNELKALVEWRAGAEESKPGSGKKRKKLLKAEHMFAVAESHRLCKADQESQTHNRILYLKLKALEDKFTIQTIAQRREILLGQLTGITHDVRELVLETNRLEQVQASYRSRRSDGIIQPAKFRPGQTVFNSSVVIVVVC